MFEVAVERISLGNVEIRKWIAHLRELSVAAFGNLQRAREYARRTLENLVHLVVTLHIKFAALEFHAISILNAFAGLNADHHVLRVCIVFT